MQTIIQRKAFKINALTHTLNDRWNIYTDLKSEAIPITTMRLNNYSIGESTRFNYVQKVIKEILTGFCRLFYNQLHSAP